MKNTVNMVAAYIGDGYLYGAAKDEEDGPAVSDPSYWLQLRLEGQGFELVELKKVPEDLAEKLEAQGTSDQDFSDGYEAASAAAPYVGATVWEEEADDDDDDEDDDDEDDDEDDEEGDIP